MADNLKTVEEELGKKDNDNLIKKDIAKAKDNNIAKKKTKKSKAISSAKATPLVVVCALVGFGGGLLGNFVYSSNGSTTVEKQRIVLNNQGSLIADIAKDVGKSVVSINVTQTVVSNSFFGPMESEAQAAGTGVIISDKGLILTNRHVVPKGTTSASVTLSDGTRFDDVEVIGRTGDKDPLDIAFLKIKDLKGTKLTSAKLGDSSKVVVGDNVVAIGNALGQFQNTVTTGIISGYGRNLVASSGSSYESLENLFQTDTAINQGNSGGPLVNLAGEVVGINVAAAGDAQSVGFAIPIDDIKGLIKNVDKNGKLIRPYLGVAFMSITADVSKNYALPVDEGAYLAPQGVIGQPPIISGGPADKAGLKAGDIIIKIDGEKVDVGHSLTSILGKYQPGDKVKIEVLRGNKTLNIDVRLGKQDD